MYAKLVLRNARRSIQDYLVYLLTMTVCVTLFYSFLSISSSYYVPDIGLSLIHIYLAMHPGQTFSKEQLYEAAFGYDGEADASAVTEHIKNIRAKLRPAGESPIETVWGVGYKWKNG